MAIKQEFHAIKGIQRDLTRSKFSPEFAFDAHNIRITARDSNTLLSVTNERGTKECVLKDSNLQEATIEGNYLGHCVLNDYLVLFTLYNDVTNIYRLENKDTHFEVVTLLYHGGLNCNVTHPIDTLGIFETIDVQKVYWTDNLNPIRYINITKTYPSNTVFDLVKFSSYSNLRIEKIYDQGNFASGIVQYACTYYSLYGSETGIFAISDLNYCSFKDRGASPEETVNCSFQIYSSSTYPIKTEYDYIRIYSIHRTSLNATPTVKVVADISTKNIPMADSEEYVFYIDTGTTGEIVDPTTLQYIGGENLVAKTLTTKDNTLFAGNIKLTKKAIPQYIRDSIKNCDVSFRLSNPRHLQDLNSSYSYNNQLNYNSNTIKGFKARECYRFGVQFKDQRGNWSEVLFIKDSTCNISPSISNYSTHSTIQIPKAYITLPSSLVRNLYTSGYISARGVCVYPSFNDRNVICQGVVCPTVYNVLDRYTNSPHVQSSWFTRPIPYDESWIEEYRQATHDGTTPSDPSHKIEDGEVLYFNHQDIISGDKTDFVTGTLNIKNYDLSRAEVQTSDALNVPYDKEHIQKNRGTFGVDCGTVTMYSPDIEFDTSISQSKDANYKFRIVGAILMANTLSDVNITTSTSGSKPGEIGYFGNIFKNKTISEALNLKSGRGISTSPLWSAGFQYEANVSDNFRSFLWAVYPWHRSGSLCGSGMPEEGEKRAWDLKRKIMSQLWVSNTTEYLNELYDKNISPVNIWHSGDSLIKIKVQGDPNRKEYYYYGDIDKVIAYDSYNHPREGVNGKSYGYDIYVADPRQKDGSMIDLNTLASSFNTYVNKAIDERVEITDNVWYTVKAKDCIGVEPISMKYKSCPHAVFAFNFEPTLINGVTVPTQTILPNNGYNINDNSDVSGPCLYGTEESTYKQDTIGIYNPNKQAFMWLGELYRDNVENRFGGDSEQAILNNIWEIASDEIQLVDSTETFYDREILYSGDTYTQRYDALRTYEYTSEDTNSIVDILSFMCETRVNIDGRYDRNRGNISNLTTTPQNFNLLNPVYNQRNNYFNYHTLDYNKFSNDYFPNTIVWSKEKKNSEEIDTWSNLNMLSSLDLDGDKDEIESLNTFNNEIYCFQKRGLSNILFNSRVQIPVSDGVPIEITNGLKVGGKRYVSNTIGCSNKWSIAETPAGLYFIDNETNSLYLFNGQIQSLSDKLGFRQWIGENNSHEQWDPINYKNFRTYYDKNNDDVYFINDKTCLCYSELLNQFTSFMSYEKVPAMFNINSEFYSFNKGKLWHNFEGEYNMFYGEFKPYSITVVANSDEPYDKIFNTVEFRSDSWNNDELINNQTFDTLEVWNEYQHGSSKLEFNKGIPSVLKKKFRIWRANIPRDTSNHRDRIRNTWAYIKLSMNTPNTWRTEFHDMNVHYFI